MKNGNRTAVVVGAGPAGLATSHELARRGIDHVVFERGDAIGYTWTTLYDSLVLHTGKHGSALPGMPFGRSTPIFPTRRQFVDYLARYAASFRLPVETACAVTGVARADGCGWTIRTSAATVHARALVIATGIASSPHVPGFPGRDAFRGRVLHSREYRRPDGFVGRRVLVVGVGNSAGEIAAELATAGAAVTLAVRSGARVVPRDMLGIPVHYLALATSRLPRRAQQSMLSAMGRVSALVRGPAVLPPPRDQRCSGVPLIGFHLVDAIRHGLIDVKGGVERFTPDGVGFADGSEAAFDEVILATGYRAAVEFLNGLATVDDCGFARRRDRVASADQPDLYFVGHNYDTRGALFNIGRDARLAAAQIAERLRTG